MLIRQKLFLSLVASALIVASAFAIDGFSLKFTPKVDTVLKFRLKGDFVLKGETPAQDTPLGITLLTIYKIVKVENNGNYQVQSTQSDIKASMSGQEIDLSSGSPITGTYGPNGVLVSMLGDAGDPKVYRMQNLRAFVRPDKDVKAGDSWTYDYKPDSKTGVVAATADFTVLGDERIGLHDTVKVKFSVKETSGTTPAASEGTQWIDKVDGEVVKLDCTWTNAPMPSSPTPLTGKVSMTRLD